MKLTKTTVAQIQREIADAVASVAAKHNLQLSPSRARYSDSNIKLSMELTAVSESGEPADFAAHARLLGLPADCYGKTITTNSRTLSICGIKLRNRKYPVLAKDDGGRTYKLSETQVALLLRLAAA